MQGGDVRGRHHAHFLWHTGLHRPGGALKRPRSKQISLFVFFSFLHLTRKMTHSGHFLHSVNCHNKICLVYLSMASAGLLTRSLILPTWRPNHVSPIACSHRCFCYSHVTAEHISQSGGAMTHNVNKCIDKLKYTFLGFSGRSIFIQKTERPRPNNTFEICSINYIPGQRSFCQPFYRYFFLYWSATQLPVRYLVPNKMQELQHLHTAERLYDPRLTSPVPAFSFHPLPPHH